MKSKFYLTGLLCLFLCQSIVVAQEVQYPQISTNGTVYDIYEDGDKIYIAGSFSRAGIYTGRGALLPGAGDMPAQPLPDVDGSIQVAIPDGSGGWYIGGSFNNVNGIPRDDLAHILSDNTLDLSFDAGGTNSTIFSMVLEGNTLYVGGAFSQINGTERSRLAAINANTGALQSWNPGAGGTVTALAVKDDILYVGGNFNELAGKRQNNFGQLNTNTGELIPSVSINSTVNSIELDGDEIYLGGSFTQGGFYTENTALFEDGSDIPVPDFPLVDGTIHVVIPDGSGGWYIGGSFNNVNGIPRDDLAHIFADNTLDPAFDAGGTNSSVFAMALAGNTLYVGGAFSQINGTERLRLAAVNANSGALQSWNPGAGGTITALAVKDDILYVGGNFNELAGKEQYNFGQIDINTEELLQSVSMSSTVNTISLDGDDVYLGGSFSQGGYFTDAVALYEDGSDVPEAEFPVFESGNVQVAIPDGSGGWYIGGSFNDVDGIERDGIAHVLSDNTLDESFDAGAITGFGNNVNALVLKDNILYIGGSFSQVDGTERLRLAALNATTGALLPWNPGANSTINTMELNGNTLFVGGSFTTIAGTTRNRLASIDINTGNLSSWNPDVNSTVNELIIDGNELYVAGFFNQINSNPHPYVARFNLSTLNLDSWSPNPNSTVNAVAINGNQVYLGGSFNSVNSTSQSNFAIVDKNTGNLSGSQISVNNTVWAIEVVGNTIYLGGSFTQVEGSERKYAAAFNAITRNLLPWDAAPNTTVLHIASNANQVILGGDFTYTKSKNYTNALVFGADELIKDWNPNPNSTINAIEVANDKIYLGGSFNAINGVSQGQFAIVDKNNGTLTGSQLSVNSTVQAIHQEGNRVYLGGNFSEVEGLSRQFAAAIDATSQTLLPWDPTPNSSVLDIASNANKLLLGGNFNYTKSKNINHALAIGSDGLIKDWNPNPNGTVREIEVSGNKVYLGGSFTAVNGVSQNRLAIVDKTSGNLSGNQANFNSTVEDIEVTSDSIFVSGSFTEVNGNTRRYVAILDATSLDLLPWDPDPNGAVNEIEYSDNQILLAGGFNYTNFKNINNALAIGSNGFIKDWNPIPNSTVRELEISGDKVYLGGNFTAVNGVSQNYFAVVDKTNGNLTGNQINFNSTVQDILVKGDSVYVGGSFTQVNGENRSYLVGYNLQSNSFLDWSPDPDDNVNTLAYDGNNLFVGGDFSFLKYKDRRNLLALDKNTRLITDWNPGFVDGAVRSVIADNSRLYLGGSFTQAQGQTRGRLAALSKTDASLQPLNVSFNSTIYDLLLRNDNLFALGSFSNVNGTNVNRVAAFNKNNGIVESSINLNFSGSASILSGLIDDNILYLGGNSTGTVNGENRGDLFAVNLSTGNLSNWSPNINGSVWDLEQKDDLIYASGSFSNFGDVVAVNKNDGIPIDLGIETNSTVFDIQLVDDKIMAAGNFSTINSEAAPYFAVINNDATLQPGTPDFNSTLHKIKYRNDTLLAGGSFTRVNNEPVRYFASMDLTVDGSNQKLDQTIAFPAISTKTLLEDPFTLQASASSGLPITFVLAGGPATLDGNVLTFTGTGNVTITAIQPGDDQYNPATEVTRTFLVTKAPQNITFNPIDDITIDTGSIELQATSSQGLPVIFNLNSGPATLDGNILTFTGTGDVSITASQPGNDSIQAAGSITRIFTILPPVIQLDLAATDILNPSDDCDLTADEFVTIQITNNSNVEVTSFQAAYKLDDLPPVIENVNLSIQPGFTANYTFSQRIDLAADGDYELEVYTIIAGDINPSNDAFMATIENLEDLTTSISDTQTICAGDQATLTATGGETYQWNNGANTATINVSPSDTVTYSVVITGENGCTATETVTVNVVPVPAPAIEATATTFCTTETAILSLPVSYSSYSWMRDGVELGTEATFEASQSGEYTVTVTNAAGCSETSEPVVLNATTATTWYADADGDGFGDPAASQEACAQPAGYVDNDEDCDDGNASVNPEATEIPNDGIDQDCDGEDLITTQVDLAITAIVNPVDACDLGTDEHVTVEITNNGDTPASAFEVAYRLDDLSPVVENATITIQPGMSANYTFTTPLNLSADGEYQLEAYVTIADDANTSNDDLQVAIENLPAPETSITEDQTVCAGEQVTLTASGGASYLWSNGATSASINVNPVASTEYSVTITGENGCTATESVMVNISEGITLTLPEVSPGIGSPEEDFVFSVVYTDPDGSMPAAGFPKLELDANNDGDASDPLDKVVTLTAADAGDNDVTDGKTYQVSVSDLSAGLNYQYRFISESSIGCDGVTSFVQGPVVSDDLLDVSIFASDISFSKPNPALLEPIEIFARIRNNSDFNAEDFQVSIFAEDELLYTETGVSVDPQSTTTLSWEYAFETSNFVPIKVVIDETNVLDEENELNNFAIRPIIVGDFVLPGGISVDAQLVDNQVFAGSNITVTGSASYFGVEEGVDTDVAGAQIDGNIEGGRSGIGYTRSDGTFTYSLKVPNDAGNYQLNLEVTDFTLTSEVQSFTFEVVPLPPQPDVVAVISFPSQVIQGESTSGVAQVINVGDLVAENFTFTYSSCETDLGSEFIASLAPGQSLDFPFTITLNDAVSCFERPNCIIVAQADVNNVVVESTETNNLASKNVKVLPAGIDLQPILTIGDLNMLQEATIPVQIRNNGFGNAGVFDANVYVDGNLIDTRTFDQLSGCGNLNYNVAYTFADLSDKVIRVTVDEPLGSGNVSEYNENNNEIQKTIAHRPPPPPLPNLTISVRDLGISPNTYSEIGSGNSFELQASFKNKGNAPVEAPFDVRLSIAGDESQTFVKTIEQDLEAGGDLTVAQNTALSNLGNNTFKAELDIEDEITESSEFDNEAQVPLCLDLRALRTGRVWQGNFYSDVAQRLTARIENLGLLSAEDVTFTFYLNENELASTTTEIDGTSSLTLSLPYTFTQSGRFLLKVKADSPELFMECNEENNVYADSITILDPAPDLRVLSEYISPTELNPDLDEPINIFLSFENIGIERAPSFTTRVAVDDVTLGDIIRVPALDPGEDGTVAIAAPYSSATGGVKIIRGFVDVDEEIEESDETNNEASRAIIVGDAPNLLFTNIDFNICPNNGDEVTITAEILNEGDLGSDAEIIYFYVTEQLDTIPIETVSVSVEANSTATSSINWTVVNNEYTIYAKIANSEPQEYNVLDNDINGEFCLPTVVSYNLTLNKQGQGIVRKSPDQANYEEGTDVNLTAIPAEGWYFEGFSGDLTGTNAEASITMDDDKTVTATFKELAPTTYALNVSIQGQGTVAKTPDKGAYNEGETVELVATPAAGWEFEGWDGDASGDSNPLQVTMDESKNIVARFVRIIDVFTLEVNTIGEGGVFIDPDQEVYNEGEEVTLTATPAEGWMFTSWSGDEESSEPTITLIMDSDKQVTATFEEVVTPMYSLTVTTEGEGTVTLDPDQESYEEGEEVTLTATPAEGWTFTGWSGDEESSEPSITLIMDSDKQVTATFEEVVVTTYSLSVDQRGQGMIMIDPEADTYESGAEVQLTAIPASGWQFVGWTGDLVSENGQETITIDANKQITAVFEEVTVERFSLTVNIEGEGSVEISPEQDDYESGSQVSLTATPAEGWKFVGWSGDVTVAIPTVSFMMNADKLITAVFEPEQGQVVEKLRLTSMCSNEPSVQRRWRVRNPNSFAVEVDWQVYGTSQMGSLTAQPGDNFFFTNTIGGSNTTKISWQNEDGKIKSQVKASSGQACNIYSLTTAVVGEGSVSIEPAQDLYAKGSVVTVSAVAEPGWKFVSWTGDIAGNSSSIELLMDGDKQVTVTFEEDKPVVQRLVFTSMCSNNPVVQRRWRVRNPNDFAVEVDWKVYGTSQSGTITAQPGDNFFFTNTVGGSNTTKIYWQDENGERKVLTKASSGNQCTTTARLNNSAENPLLEELPAEQLSEFKAEVYPNPVQQQMHLRITSDKEMEIMVMVYNLVGIAVAEKTIALQEGVNDTWIELNRHPNGMYLVMITDKTGAVIDDFKILKQR